MGKPSSKVSFCLYLLIAKGFTEVYKGLKGIFVLVMNY